MYYTRSIHMVTMWQYRIEWVHTALTSSNRSWLIYHNLHCWKLVWPLSSWVARLMYDTNQLYRMLACTNKNWFCNSLLLILSSKQFFQGFCQDFSRSHQLVERLLANYMTKSFRHFRQTFIKKVSKSSSFKNNLSKVSRQAEKISTET